MADSKPAIYACERHPGFFFRAGEKRFRFEKHQLTVEDPKDVEEIDKLLAENSVFAAKIKKVSVTQAEALVAEHQRTHGGAKSGPFASSDMAQNQVNRMGQIDATLDKLPNDAKADLQTALAEDGLVKTDKVDTSAPSAGGLKLGNK